MPKNQWHIFVTILIFFSIFIGTATQAEQDKIGVVINNGNPTTDSHYVALKLYAPAGTTQMRISNDGNFDTVPWEPYVREKKWSLDFSAKPPTVFVEFRQRGEKPTTVYRDSITISIPSQIAARFTINDNEESTDSRYVTLNLEYSNGVDEVAISNSSNFSDIRYVPAQKRFAWILTPNTGTKNVYVRFRDAHGTVKTIMKTIFYQQPANHIPEGTLLKGDKDTVYYLGYDGQIHPYLHAVVFHSYTQNYSTIRRVSNQTLRKYQIGQPVCMRPGTWLVKFQSLPRVYAVEPGCALRPIRSEVEAFILYGARWNERILEIAPAFEFFYHIRERTDLDRSVDRDQDGLDVKQEETYGTSDLRGDSDGDRVSDYEEINFWFTNPTLKDTDGDGVWDGDEILLKRAPNGSGRITEIPQASYTAFLGTVIFDWWNSQNMYYSYQDGYNYYISSDTNAEAFTSNGFQASFVTYPPFPLPLNPRSGWRVQPDSLQIKAPLITRNNKIVPL